MEEITHRRPSLGTVFGSAGMVFGLLALIVSLSGVATAGQGRTVLVQRGGLAPGSVTAKSLAKGAVHNRALAKSAVNSRAIADNAVNKRTLGKGVVTTRSLAANAVTASQLAPGSVYGGALGTQSIHAVSIKDLDAVASNPEWTAGDSGVVLCAPGEALIGSGFAMPNPGNREVTWLQVAPFLSPSTGSGVNARMATNSGGTAEGQVLAICLK